MTLPVSPFGQGPAGPPPWCFTFGSYTVPPATGGPSVQQVVIQIGPGPNGVPAASTAAGLFAPFPVQISSPLGANLGVYNVVAVAQNGLSITLQNNGAVGNPTPGTPIPSTSAIAPTGAPAQNPIVQTTAPFTIPAISVPGQPPTQVQMALTSNAPFLLGGEAFGSGTTGTVNGQAYLQVVAVNPDGLHITVQNNGQAENSAPGTTLLAGAPVLFTGGTGPSTVGELIVPPPGSVNLWVDLESDGLQTLTTLSPVLNEKEQITGVAQFYYEQIGANGIGGEISRKFNLQLVTGVPTSMFNGATGTGNIDVDVSSPPPPGNLNTPIAGCAGFVNPSGSGVIFQASRPTGVPTRVRLVVGYTRALRPAGPYINSLTPNSAPSGVATTIAIAGEGLATTTAVTFGSGAGSVQGTPGDLSLQVNTPTSVSGTVGVTVTTPSGSYLFANGFTFTSGIVYTIQSVSPNFDRAEGGRTIVITGVPGTNFNGNLGTTIGGVAVGSPVIGGGGTTITCTVPTGLTPGLLNVNVQSPNNNPSIGGTGKFFAWPTGVITMGDAQLATSSGGNLSTWADVVSGSGYSIVIASSPPVHANEITGPLGPMQSVVFKNGVGFFAWTSATTYTGIVATVGFCGTRPITPSANSRLLSAYDHTQNVTDITQAGSMVFEDSGSTVGSAVARNGASSPSLFSPASNSVPFFASLRCDGVTGVTSRVNGVDLAVVAQTGALGINEYCAGAGIAQGLGRFGAGTQTEEHWLLGFIANRNFTQADFNIITAFNSFYFGLSLAA